MGNLIDLIEQSRNWASVKRGRVLWPKVRDVIKNTFDIDAGMFVYHKPFVYSPNTPKVSHPWGLGYSADKLTTFLPYGEWFSQDPYEVSERWLHSSEVPPVCRKVWIEAGIEYVGSWPFTVNEQRIGAMVLGRKSIPAQDNGDLMAACATYISLILEMLTLRRIAEHASRHDPLTNILNRRGFMEQFEYAMNHAKRHLIIGIVDVNDFKAINDTQGHTAGDFVLKDVANNLQTMIGDKGICARFGGDEFVFAIASEVPNIEDTADEIAARFAGKKYSVSVGCACTGIDAEDWDSCFQIADNRLYQNKV